MDQLDSRVEESGQVPPTNGDPKSTSQTNPPDINWGRGAQYLYHELKHEMPDQFGPIAESDFINGFRNPDIAKKAVDMLLKDPAFTRIDKVPSSPTELYEKLRKYAASDSDLSVSREKFVELLNDEATRDNVLRQVMDKNPLIFRGQSFEAVSSRLQGKGTPQVSDEVVYGAANKAEEELRSKMVPASRGGRPIGGKDAIITYGAEDERRKVEQARSEAVAQLPIEDRPWEDIHDFIHGEGTYASRVRAAEVAKEQIEDRQQENKIFSWGRLYDRTIGALAGENDGWRIEGDKVFKEVGDGFGYKRKEIPSSAIIKANSLAELGEDGKDLNELEFINLKAMFLRPEEIRFTQDALRIASATKMLNSRAEVLENTILNNLGIDKEAWEVVNEKANRQAPLNIDERAMLERFMNAPEFASLSKVYDRFSEVQEASEKLPTIYPSIAALNRLREDLQRSTDSKYSDHMSARAYTMMQSLVSGIQKSPTSLYRSLLSAAALVGVDSAADALEISASKQRTSEMTPSQIKRGVFEQAADYIDTDGQVYEVVFDGEEVTAIYDNRGIPLEGKRFQAMAAKPEVIARSEQASRTFNGSSALAGGLKVMGDMAVTMALTRGVGGAFGATARGLSAMPRTASLAARVSALGQSDRFVGVASTVGQYFGDLTVDAMESGKMDPQSAAVVGAMGSMTESLSEAMSGGLARIARGGQNYATRFMNRAGNAAGRTGRAAAGAVSRADRARAFASAFASEQASEMTEELIATATEGLTQQFANSYLGGEYDDPGFNVTMDDVLSTIVVTGIGTFLPSSISGLANAFEIGSSDFVQSGLMAIARNPEQFDNFKEAVNTEVTRGNVSQQEADRVIKAAESYLTNITAPLQALEKYVQESDSNRRIRKEVKTAADDLALELSKANWALQHAAMQVDRANQEGQDQSVIAGYLNDLETAILNYESTQRKLLSLIDPAAYDRAEEARKQREQEGPELQPIDLDDIDEAIDNVDEDPESASMAVDAALGEDIQVVAEGERIVSSASVPLAILAEYAKREPAFVEVDGEMALATYNKDTGNLSLFFGHGQSREVEITAENAFQFASQHGIKLATVAGTHGYDAKGLPSYLSIDGAKYTFGYTDPAEAIEYNEDGSVKSVEVFGMFGRADGQIRYKREVLTGVKAEVIARILKARSKAKAFLDSNLFQEIQNDQQLQRQESEQAAALAAASGGVSGPTGGTSALEQQLGAPGQQQAPTSQAAEAATAEPVEAEPDPVVESTGEGQVPDGAVEQEPVDGIPDQAEGAGQATPGDAADAASENPEQATPDPGTAPTPNVVEQAPAPPVQAPPVQAPPAPAPVVEERALTPEEARVQEMRTNLNELEDLSEVDGELRDPNSVDLTDILEDHPEELSQLNDLGVPPIQVLGGSVARRRKMRLDGQGVVGSKGQVRLGPGKYAPFRYRLIEAEDLQASHHLDGRPNEGHFLPDAQPKDRSLQDSKLDRRRIAMNLIPSEMGRFDTLLAGAPNVNLRGEVIQGNNRAGALKDYYTLSPNQTNRRYERWLEENAGEFGFTGDQVKAMRQPILVREFVASDAQSVQMGQLTGREGESGNREMLDSQRVVNLLGDRIFQVIDALFAGNGEENFTTIRAALQRNKDRVFQHFVRAGFGADILWVFERPLGTVASELQSLFTRKLFGGRAAIGRAFEGLSDSTTGQVTANIGRIALTLGKSNSILPLLNRAIMLAYRARVAGFDRGVRLESILEFTEQGDFINRQRYGAATIALASLIMDPAGGARALGLFLEKYNRATSPSETGFVGFGFGEPETLTQEEFFESEIAAMIAAYTLDETVRAQIKARIGSVSAKEFTEVTLEEQMLELGYSDLDIEAEANLSAEERLGIERYSEIRADMRDYGLSGRKYMASDSNVYSIDENGLFYRTRKDGRPYSKPVSASKQQWLRKDLRDRAEKARLRKDPFRDSVPTQTPEGALVQAELAALAANGQLPNARKPLATISEADFSLLPPEMQSLAARLVARTGTRTRITVSARGRRNIQQSRSVFSEVEGAFDEESGETFLVSGRATEATLLHEAVGHALAVRLEAEKPELYRRLVDEAASDPQIKELVDTRYPDADLRTKENEMFVRFLDKHIVSETEGRPVEGKVRGILTELWQMVKDMLADVFGVNQDAFANIPFDVTMGELAKLATDANTRLDLRPLSQRLARARELRGLGARTRRLAEVFQSTSNMERMVRRVTRSFGSNIRVVTQAQADRMFASQNGFALSRSGILRDATPLVDGIGVASEDLYLLNNSQEVKTLADAYGINVVRLGASYDLGVPQLLDVETGTLYLSNGVTDVDVKPVAEIAEKLQVGNVNNLRQEIGKAISEILPEARFGATVVEVNNPESMFKQSSGNYAEVLDKLSAEVGASSAIDSMVSEIAGAAEAEFMALSGVNSLFDDNGILHAIPQLTQNLGRLIGVKVRMPGSNEILNEKLAKKELAFKRPGYPQSIKSAPTKEELRKMFPEAVVVQSQSSLPVEALAALPRATDVVKGVYVNSKVYLVAENIDSMADAVKVYRHERLGHASVKKYLKEDLANYATSIVENASVLQREVLDMLKAKYSLPNNLSADQKAFLGEEYIAYIAENPTEKPTLWERLAMRVRSAIRRLGIRLAISDKEIASMIMASVYSDERGRSRRVFRALSEYFAVLGQTDPIFKGIDLTPRFSLSGKRMDDQSEVSEQEIAAELIAELEMVANMFGADLPNVDSARERIRMEAERAAAAPVEEVVDIEELPERILEGRRIQNIYKKAFGESAAKFIRTNSEKAFWMHEAFIPYLKKVIPIKSHVLGVLEHKIADITKAFLIEQGIEVVEEVIDPTVNLEETLRNVGYAFEFVESFQDSLKYKHWYASGEDICTFTDSGRTRSKFVTFIVRDDAADTPRADKLNEDNLTPRWKEYLKENGRYDAKTDTYNLDDLYPEREDPYSTSVLAVQLYRNDMGVYRVISRYNHRVSDPDYTYDRDLNKIAENLKDAYFNTFYSDQYSSENNKVFVLEVDSQLFFVKNTQYLKNDVEINYENHSAGVFSGDGFYIYAIMDSRNRLINIDEGADDPNDHGQKVHIIDTNKQKVYNNLLLTQGKGVEVIKPDTSRRSLIPIKEGFLKTGFEIIHQNLTNPRFVGPDTVRYSQLNGDVDVVIKYKFDPETREYIAIPLEGKFTEDIKKAFAEQMLLYGYASSGILNSAYDLRTDFEKSRAYKFLSLNVIADDEARAAYARFFIPSDVQVIVGDLDIIDDTQDFSSLMAVSGDLRVMSNVNLNSLIEAKNIIIQLNENYKSQSLRSLTTMRELTFYKNVNLPFHFYIHAPALNVADLHLSQGVVIQMYAPSLKKSSSLTFDRGSKLILSVPTGIEPGVLTDRRLSLGAIHIESDSRFIIEESPLITIESIGVSFDNGAPLDENNPIILVKNVQEAAYVKHFADRPTDDPLLSVLGNFEVRSERMNVSRGNIFLSDAPEDIGFSVADFFETGTNVVSNNIHPFAVLQDKMKYIIQYPGMESVSNNNVSSKEVSFFSKGFKELILDSRFIIDDVPLHTVFGLAFIKHIENSNKDLYDRLLKLASSERFDKLIQWSSSLMIDKKETEYAKIYLFIEQMSELKSGMDQFFTFSNNIDQKEAYIDYSLAMTEALEAVFNVSDIASVTESPFLSPRMTLMALRILLVNSKENVVNGAARITESLGINQSSPASGANLSANTPSGFAGLSSSLNDEGNLEVGIDATVGDTSIVVSTEVPFYSAISEDNLFSKRLKLLLERVTTMVSAFQDAGKELEVIRTKQDVDNSIKEASSQIYKNDESYAVLKDKTYRDLLDYALLNRGIIPVHAMAGYGPFSSIRVQHQIVVSDKATISSYGVPSFGPIIDAVKLIPEHVEYVRSIPSSLDTYDMERLVNYLVYADQSSVNVDRINSSIIGGVPDLLAREGIDHVLALPTFHIVRNVIQHINVGAFNVSTELFDSSDIYTNAGISLNDLVSEILEAKEELNRSREKFDYVKYIPLVERIVEARNLKARVAGNEVIYFDFQGDYIDVHRTNGIQSQLADRAYVARSNALAVVYDRIHPDVRAGVALGFSFVKMLDNLSQTNKNDSVKELLIDISTRLLELDVSAIPAQLDYIGMNERNYAIVIALARYGMPGVKERISDSELRFVVDTLERMFAVALSNALNVPARKISLSTTMGELAVMAAESYSSASRLPVAMVSGVGEAKALRPNHSAREAHRMVSEIINKASLETTMANSQYMLSVLSKIYGTEAEGNVGTLWYDSSTANPNERFIDIYKEVWEGIKDLANKYKLNIYGFSDLYMTDIFNLNLDDRALYLPTNRNYPSDLLTKIREVLENMAELMGVAPNELASHLRSNSVGGSKLMLRNELTKALSNAGYPSSIIGGIVSYVIKTGTVFPVLDFNMLERSVNELELRNKALETSRSLGLQINEIYLVDENLTKVNNIKIAASKIDNNTVSLSIAFKDDTGRWIPIPINYVDFTKIRKGDVDEIIGNHLQQFVYRMNGAIEIVQEVMDQFSDVNGGLDISNEMMLGSDPDIASGQKRVVHILKDDDVNSRISYGSTTFNPSRKLAFLSAAWNTGLSPELSAVTVDNTPMSKIRYYDLTYSNNVVGHVEIVFAPTAQFGAYYPFTTESREVNNAFPFSGDGYRVYADSTSIASFNLVLGPKSLNRLPRFLVYGDTTDFADGVNDIMNRITGSSYISGMIRKENIPTTVSLSPIMAAAMRYNIINYMLDDIDSLVELDYEGLQKEFEITNEDESIAFYNDRVKRMIDLFISNRIPDMTAYILEAQDFYDRFVKYVKSEKPIGLPYYTAEELGVDDGERTFYFHPEKAFEYKVGEDVFSDNTKPLFRRENGLPLGMYDPETATALIYADRVDETTLLHEIFTHPFLIKAQRENPELYKNLLAEAKADQDVMERVSREYPELEGTALDHEIIAAAIDMHAQGFLNAESKGTLRQLLEAFWKTISSALAKIMNIPEVRVADIQPNLTLKELAYFGIYSDAQIDLRPTPEPVRSQLPEGITAQAGGQTYTMVDGVWMRVANLAERVEPVAGLTDIEGGISETMALGQMIGIDFIVPAPSDPIVAELEAVAARQRETQLPEVAATRARATHARNVFDMLLAFGKQRNMSSSQTQGMIRLARTMVAAQAKALGIPFEQALAQFELIQVGNIEAIEGSLQDVNLVEQIELEGTAAQGSVTNGIRGAFVKVPASPDGTRPEKMRIVLSSQATASTLLHEMAHSFERLLTPGQKRDVLAWLGHKEWSRSTSEAFAENFEAWVAGKGPLNDQESWSSSILKAFHSFAEYIADVAANALGYPRLTPEVVNIYREMVGLPELDLLDEKYTYREDRVVVVAPTTNGVVDDNLISEETLESAGEENLLTYIPSDVLEVLSEKQIADFLAMQEQLRALHARMNLPYDAATIIPQAARVLAQLNVVADDVNESPAPGVLFSRKKAVGFGEAGDMAQVAEYAERSSRQDGVLVLDTPFGSIAVSGDLPNRQILMLAEKLGIRGMAFFARATSAEVTYKQQRIRAAMTFLEIDQVDQAAPTSKGITFLGPKGVIIGRFQIQNTAMLPQVAAALGAEKFVLDGDGVVVAGEVNQIGIEGGLAGVAGSGLNNDVNEKRGYDLTPEELELVRFGVSYLVNNPLSDPKAMFTAFGWPAHLIAFAKIELREAIANNGRSSTTDYLSAEARMARELKMASAPLREAKRIEVESWLHNNPYMTIREVLMALGAHEYGLTEADFPAKYRRRRSNTAARPRVDDPNDSPTDQYNQLIEGASILDEFDNLREQFFAGTLDLDFIDEEPNEVSESGRSSDPTIRMWSRTTRRILADDTVSPEVRAYLAQKQAGKWKSMSVNVIHDLATKIASMPQNGKQIAAMAVGMRMSLGSNIANGLRGQDPSNIELIVLRILAKRADEMGYPQLSSDIYEMVAESSSQIGRYLNTLRSLDNGGPMDLIAAKVAYDRKLSLNRSIVPGLKLSPKQIADFIWSKARSAVSTADLARYAEQIMVELKDMQSQARPDLRTEIEKLADKAFFSQYKMNDEQTSPPGEVLYSAPSWSKLTDDQKQYFIDRAELAYGVAELSDAKAKKLWQKSVGPAYAGMWEEMNLDPALASKVYYMRVNRDLNRLEENVKAIAANGSPADVTALDKVTKELLHAVRMRRMKDLSQAKSVPDSDIAVVQKALLGQGDALTLLKEARQNAIRAAKANPSPEAENAITILEDIIYAQYNEAVGLSGMRSRISKTAASMNKTVAQLASDRFLVNVARESIVKDLLLHGLDAVEAQEMAEAIRRAFDKTIRPDLEKDALRVAREAFADALTKRFEEIDTLIHNEEQKILFHTSNGESALAREAARKVAIAKKHRKALEREVDKLLRAKQNTIGGLVDLLAFGSFTYPKMDEYIASLFGMNPMPEVDLRELELLAVQLEAEQDPIIRKKLSDAIAAILKRNAKKISGSQRFLEFMLEYIYTNMLSSPLTALAAAAGNIEAATWNIFLSEFVRIPTMLFNAIRTGSALEVKLMIKAIKSAVLRLGPGLQAYKHVLVTGEITSGITELDDRQRMRESLDELARGKLKSLLDKRDAKSIAEAIALSLPIVVFVTQNYMVRLLYGVDAFSRIVLKPYLAERMAQVDVLKHAKVQGGLFGNEQAIFDQVSDLLGETSEVKDMAKMIINMREGKALNSPVSTARPDYTLLVSQLAEHHGSEIINRHSDELSKELAGTGNIWGPMGMILNPILNYKLGAASKMASVKKQYEEGEIDTGAYYGKMGMHVLAQMAVTLLVPFPRVIGVVGNMALRAQPFALVKIDGLKKTFPFVRMSVNDSISMWNGAFKVDEKVLTDYQLFANQVLAVGPTIIAAMMFAMLFEIEAPDDEDEDSPFGALNRRIKLKEDSNVRITGSGGGQSFSRVTQMSGQGWAPFEIQRKGEDGVWRTVYNYRNTPGGGMLAWLGSMTDQIMLNSQDNVVNDVTVTSQVINMPAAFGGYLMQLGFAQTMDNTANMLDVLENVIGGSVNSSATQQDIAFTWNKSLASAVRPIVPGGNLANFMEKIRVSSGGYPKTGVAVNRTIGDALANNIFFSNLFNENRLDSYGYPKPPLFRLEGLTGAAIENSIFSDKVEDIPAGKALLNKLNVGNNMTMWYPRPTITTSFVDPETSTGTELVLVEGTSDQELLSQQSFSLNLRRILLERAATNAEISDMANLTPAKLKVLSETIRDYSNDQAVAHYLFSKLYANKDWRELNEGKFAQFGKEDALGNVSIVHAAVAGNAKIPLRYKLDDIKKTMALQGYRIVDGQVVRMEPQSQFEGQTIKELTSARKKTSGTIKSSLIMSGEGQQISILENMDAYLP